MAIDNKNILTVKNLSYKYPDGTVALDNLSLDLKEGKTTVLLGANGAGKSTLFLNLNGILKPDSGSMRFAGKEYDYSKQGIISLRKNIGIVFQDPDDQLFSASVEQDISFGAFNLGLSKDEVKKRVDDAMQKTGIAHLKAKPTHALSYGQKKRVAIAGVLVMQPHLMILDEPTAGLDPRGIAQLLELIDNLQKKLGLTVIIATHNMDLVPEIADYIYVLGDGKNVYEGLPKDVLCQEEMLVNAGLSVPRITKLYSRLKDDGKVDLLLNDVDGAFRDLSARLLK
ncbi:MAG: energy-coupling factor ABC transporter ATP-binding protein [Clostridiales bacterium]|nr:MAG: energy-coupling factor ABC transporter ATP-binding protein [Clostridiales bacterium]